MISTLSILVLALLLGASSWSCEVSVHPDPTSGDAGVDSKADTPGVPPVDIVSIHVDPVNSTIPRGGVQPLMAIGTETDGTTVNLTELATWTSSTASVASVDARGVVTAIAGGMARVVATYGTHSGEANVTVPNAELVDLQASPPFADVASGATVSLSAIAYFSDGSTIDVTTAATWSTSDASIASVKAGIVGGVGAGKAMITASFGGRSCAATVRVS